MLEKLLEAARGKPIARVVVVDVATGEHACFDLRPGSYVLLKTGVSGRLDRLTRARAVKRALARTREQLDTAVGRLDVAIESNRELTNTVHRQGAVFAAVLEATSLEQAKARACGRRNVVL